jgi:hypothetical protein
MKYRESNPFTESNAARRSNRHDPDSHPTARSVAASLSCRYRSVHGLFGHTYPRSAWPAPDVRSGTDRADG